MFSPMAHDAHISDIREVDVHVQRSQFQALTQEMTQIDKSELHLHLGGSWPIDYLAQIADPALFLELSRLLDQIQNGVNYHEAFRVFELTGKIVNTDQKVEDGVVALCKTLADDRVIYAEIRTGLKDLGSGLEGYLNALLRGVKQGCAHHKLTVDVVLSLRRDSVADVAHKTVELIRKYRHHGVVGLDLSGDSTRGDGKDIFQAIAQAQAQNIPITLHIGESPKETAEQQLKELQTIKPQRIGHGVHLCPEAIKLIREKKIPVELCLTSAVKVGMIGEARMHPGLALLSQNHPVVICTDDPLIFRTTLSEECAHVARINKLNKTDMIKLQKQALEYRLK